MLIIQCLVHIQSKKNVFYLLRILIGVNKALLSCEQGPLSLEFNSKEIGGSADQTILKNGEFII